MDRRGFLTAALAAPLLAALPVPAMVAAAPAKNVLINRTQWFPSLTAAFEAHGRKWVGLHVFVKDSPPITLADGDRVMDCVIQSAARGPIFWVEEFGRDAVIAGNRFTLPAEPAHG